MLILPAVSTRRRTGARMHKQLDNFARNDEPQDYEPDEFIVNIEGLSASFYFDGTYTFKSGNARGQLVG